MEEKKNSSRFNKIISIIVVGLLIFSLIQNANLTTKIENLSSANSRLNSEIINIKSSIASISSGVEIKLKEQTSLISGVDYSIGTPNKDMKTVPVTISVVPKAITDDTKLSISIDGTTAPFERNGNEFSGSIDVGMFIGYDSHPLLLVETSEGTKTEYLEDIDISYIFEKYLPSMNADIDRTSSWRNGVMNITSILDILLHEDKLHSDVTFTSFYLVEEFNGEEIGREDITDKVRQGGDEYSADYYKQLNISDEYEFRVYVIAEDSLGYIHKVLAGYWSNDTTNAMVENALSGEIILDKEGNVLFDKYAYID